MRYRTQQVSNRHIEIAAHQANTEVAMCSAKPYSDLDLAIIGEQPLSIALLAALEHDFTESDLPFKVGVIDWATTSEGFCRIIARDRVVLK